MAVELQAVKEGQEASLWEDLLKKVVDIGGDVARTWAQGEYQTYEAGPGGTYPQGQTAGVSATSPWGGASLSVSPMLLVLGAAGVVGLFLLLR